MIRTSIRIDESVFHSLKNKLKKNGSNLKQEILALTDKISEMKYFVISKTESESKKMTHTISFEDEEISKIDNLAETYDLSRSEFINSALLAKDRIQLLAETSQNKPQNNTLDWVSSAENYLHFLQNLKKSEISFKNEREAIQTVLSHKFFQKLDVGAGIFIKEGNLLQFYEVTNYHYNKAIRFILPIPYQMIRFPITSDNLIVKSCNNQETYVSMDLWQLAKPLLTKQMWAVIEKQLKINFYVCVPMIVNDKSYGVFIFAFTEKELELKYIEMIKKITAIAAEIIIA